MASWEHTGASLWNNKWLVRSIGVHSIQNSVIFDIALQDAWTMGLVSFSCTAQDFLYLPYDPAEGANEGGLAGCRQLWVRGFAGTFGDSSSLSLSCTKPRFHVSALVYSRSLKAYMFQPALSI